MPIKDISGKRFSKLVVIEYSHMKNERSYWICQCDCGNLKTINGPELKRGGTKSCGCLLAENGLKRRKQKPEKKARIRKGRDVTCEICNKIFFRNDCFIKNRIFCSTKCHGKSLENKVTCYCEVCGISFEISVSISKLRPRTHCSKHCSRIGRSIKQRGDKAINWKGGVSYMGNRIRKGVEWKMWREAVFKRDNYTCQECGIRSAKGVAVELHPHHIKQFALFPELRFDVDNGQTLCKPCHSKTDTYLKKPKNHDRTH